MLMPMPQTRTNSRGVNNEALLGTVWSKPKSPMMGIVQVQRLTPSLQPRGSCSSQCNSRIQYPLDRQSRHLLLSWYSPMQRRMSARMSGSCSTKSSGGMPPLLTPRLMAPRTGWKRMPMCRAARMVSSSLRKDGVRCMTAAVKSVHSRSR